MKIKLNACWSLVTYKFELCLFIHFDYFSTHVEKKYALFILYFLTDGEKEKHAPFCDEAANDFIFLNVVEIVKLLCEMLFFITIIM